jgi:hypothetical protein
VSRKWLVLFDGRILAKSRISCSLFDGFFSPESLGGFGLARRGAGETDLR